MNFLSFEVENLLKYGKYNFKVFSFSISFCFTLLLDYIVGFFLSHCIYLTTEHLDIKRHEPSEPIGFHLKTWGTVRDKCPLEEANPWLQDFNHRIVSA